MKAIYVGATQGALQSKLRLYKHIKRSLDTMFMPTSIGFSLPLLICFSVEALWGLVLLAPYPLNEPAVRLAQLTYTKTGSTMGESKAKLLNIFNIMKNRLKLPVSGESPAHFSP